MKQTLKLMFSFLLMLGTMFGISQTVLAQETHQLTIVHLEARDIDRPNPQLEIAPKEGTPIEGVLYQLYQLKSTEDGDLLAHWNSLTITELKKQAQQVFEATTNQQGKATFNQLPDGIYYGLAVKAGEKNRNVSAFLVDLSEDKVIYPKIIWSTGELDLLKVGVDGDTKKPLAGVVFELYEKNGRTPIRVKNGVHSQDIDAAKHLETDSSGHIRISGLIHGDYVLKEIETQSGYQIGQAETAVTIEKSKISLATNIRIWIFRLIFLAGFLVLAFPIVSQVMYFQASHANINAFKEAVTKIDRVEINRRLELAYAYNASIAGAKTNGEYPALKDPYSAEQKQAGVVEYARMLEVKEQIGHVIIPRINQDIPIYAGSAEENLQRGVGHLEGTSLPVGGESTHAVLTAHRGLPTAKLFTNLDKVTVGDRFYIEHIGGKIAYQVDQIKVIAPDQLEDLYVIQGEDHVTLLTCTPYMINSHRLLVRGKRIPYVEKTVQKDSKTFRQQQYLTYAMWVVVGLILLSLLIWFKKTKQKKRRKNEKAASQNSHNNSK